MPAAGARSSSGPDAQAEVRYGPRPPRDRAELARLPLPSGFEAETLLVRRAAALAASAHRGQRDKAGADYFEVHLRDVHRRAAGYGADEVERAAALLHDTEEDTNTRLADLLELGFPDEVLLIVSLMTRRADQPDSVYYALLRAHPPALRVKRDADLASNADPERLALIDDVRTASRLAQKYARVRAELSEQAGGRPGS